MGPLEHGDPERIGRYRLIGRLGAGGMGQVFFGRSAGGRAVAVKRIHPHLATDASFRERFAREVTAARQVSGAFTAPVIDADPDGDVPWLVTSYVPSLPLDDAVRAYGGLPEHTLRVLATGLAEALTEIHRVGLIHRDLKPGNVLLAEDGPRVIDFGIARATDGTAATQSIIGTPGFMSPEQVQGEYLTPASDMFAFGAVLVYAAGGVGPFGEGAMPTLVMRILQHEPDLSAVPPSLQRMVAACLAKDARNRPSPGQLLDALGDVPIGASWLPPEVMRGVRDQVAKTNAALSGAPGTEGGAPGATSVLGAAAAGAAGGAAAATARYGDHDPTRAAGPAGADPTSVMGAGGTAVGGTGQYPPPYRPDGPQTAGGADPRTRAYEPQDPAGTAAYGRHTRAYDPSTGYGGATPPTAAMPAADDDAYSDMYRGSRRADTRGPDPRAEERRRREEEERRREEEREERRRREQEREERRRREEADRAHRARVRAEQEAARRAQQQARQADQPSLWSFVKLLPLLIIPIIQIPLGTGVSYAWQWFTTESGAWGGEPWWYAGIFTLDGFFHALYLGYFLLNNIIGLEYLIRSLRTGYVVGVVLAAAVIAGTNGMLWTYGFFG